MKLQEVKKPAEEEGGMCTVNAQESDLEARNGGEVGAVGNPGMLPGLKLPTYHPVWWFYISC